MDSGLLMQYADDMGIALSEEKALLMTEYGEYILSENERINLTSIKDGEDFIIKHILDSLLVAALAEGNRTVADVGTGGGFPGVIMKIYQPALSMTLIDSVEKKLKAVKRICDELKIMVNTVHGRAEDLGKGELREKIDIVTARAVAPLTMLAEYCLPLVEVKGSFFAMKGYDVKEEIIKAQSTVKTLGGELQKTVYFELPKGMRRSIVIYSKTAPTPKGYPRSSKEIKKGIKQHSELKNAT